MQERPKIKIPLKSIDIVLELVGWCALMAIWIFTFINYSKLPDIIPMHYNMAGEADGFGRKANIFTLPLVATALFIGMSVLVRYPHIFNYPIRITADNALRQYTNATRMMRYLNLTTTVILGLIVFNTFRDTAGKANGLGVWFIVLVMGLTFIPMTWHLIKALDRK